MKWSKQLRWIAACVSVFAMYVALATPAFCEDGKAAKLESEPTKEIIDGYDDEVSPRLMVELKAPEVASPDDVLLYEVTQRTDGRKNAGTDDLVTMELYTSDGQVENFKLDRENYNDRRRGKTDPYPLMPTEIIPHTKIRFVVIKIHGDDAWLPSGFKLTATLRDGRTVDKFSRVPWTSGWLSTDPNDAGGQARRSITFAAGTTVNSNMEPEPVAEPATETDYSN